MHLFRATLDAVYSLPQTGLVLYSDPHCIKFFQQIVSKRTAVTTKARQTPLRVAYLARNGLPGSPMLRPHPKTFSPRCWLPEIIAEILEELRTHLGVTLWIHLWDGSIVTFKNVVSGPYPLIFLYCIHDIIQVEQKSYACCKKWYTGILLLIIFVPPPSSVMEKWLFIPNYSSFIS